MVRNHVDSSRNQIEALFLLAFSVITGGVIAIILDYFLSDWFTFHWLIFNNSKFIAVFVGSFFSGAVYKNKGWLSGLIVSFIHLVFIIFILSNPPALMADETSKINLSSYFPRGLFILVFGTIGGHIGAYCAKKIAERKT